MSKHGASELSIELDDAPGGTLTDITQYVRNDVKVKIINQLQASHPFGVEWDESSPTGHGSVEDIVLGGIFDTVIWAIVKQTAADRAVNGDTRTLRIGWVGGGSPSDYNTVECRLMSSQRIAKAGVLHDYEVVLRPTGTPTEE